MIPLEYLEVICMAAVFEIWNWLNLQQNGMSVYIWWHPDVVSATADFQGRMKPRVHRVSQVLCCSCRDSFRDMTTGLRNLKSSSWTSGLCYLLQDLYFNAAVVFSFVGWLVCFRSLRTNNIKFKNNRTHFTGWILIINGSCLKIQIPYVTAILSINWWFDWLKNCRFYLRNKRSQGRNCHPSAVVLFIKWFLLSWDWIILHVSEVSSLFRWHFAAVSVSECWRWLWNKCCYLFFLKAAAAAELQGSELENDILKSSVASAECCALSSAGKY